MLAIIGLLILAGALWVLLKYIKYRNHRKYGIPGPEPIFPFGNILTILNRIRYAIKQLLFDFHTDFRL
jgi:hypothetical protein